MTVNEKKIRGGLPPGFSPRTSEGGRQETPAAGNGNGGDLNNSGSNGNYWSSTPNSDNSNNAWNLNFNSDNFNRNNNNRNNGQSVRPLPALATEWADGDSHRLLQDLCRAYMDARRQKRNKVYQLKFEMRQESELVRLRDELLLRSYQPKPSTCFIIHDPKMREVFAAEFRDRVVHHLFYNYTHEIFERTFIADSYSCIKGRGTHYGIRRLRHHILSCSENYSKPCYVLKLDIKGYFMNIDRTKLLARSRAILQRARQSGIWGGLDFDFIDYLLVKISMLDPVEKCRVLGDREEWKKLPWDKSLFHSRPGCGLPIGNLTSQLFSNIYLGEFDTFVKRQLHCRHYGRYVDDAYIVASSKEELRAFIQPIRLFLQGRLGLELNERKVMIRNVFEGVEFLGAFIKPYRVYVASRPLRRIRGKLMRLDWLENPKRVQARVNSMLGTLSHYSSYFVRRILIHRSDAWNYGKMLDDCLRFYPDSSNRF